MIDALTMLSAAADAISYRDLGLSPIVLDLGWFQLRWYSLGYLAGIILGWWYLLKLIDQPGAPMARRHVDDMVFYATLGIILGGRLGYVIFYKPMGYLADPWRSSALGWRIRSTAHARSHPRHPLDGATQPARLAAVHDYVACCSRSGCSSSGSPIS